MNDVALEYDPRYLAGVLFFNEGAFFEAHEVWENLWMDSTGPERKFFQGLIQTAVALFHFGNGNSRGAVKLFHSSRDYLREYHPTYLGLNVEELNAQMDRCFAALLNPTDVTQRIEPCENDLPRIQLDPEPDQWPNPRDFVEADE